MDILENTFIKGLLRKEQFDGLVVFEATMATIYLLLKIHKNPVNPPGGPIVSGFNSFTEPMCKLIYYCNRWWKLCLYTSSDILCKLEVIQLVRHANGNL